MNFTEMNIPSSLRAEIIAKGYTAPTRVQEVIVAPEYATGDLLVSSKTGSGKTISFGLAFAPQLLGDAEKIAPTKTPRALIVAPTRELAQQVAEELSWLYRSAGARVATCVGGMDIRREQRQLSMGAHIVVGTPGRLNDHIKRASLKLESTDVVVLDEADEMLDMGFREELEFILDAANARTRTLLFSATIPTEIKRMAQRYTKDAKHIAIDAGEAHEDIEYIAYRVARNDKEAAVVNVLRYYEAKSSLVFVATRDGVHDLSERLMSRGFSVVSLSGELSQVNRDRAIHVMKTGHARVLVATDVAARGLDLPDVGLVIHADPPNDPSVLQHRSGRTGRAGQKGTAVILVPSSRERVIEYQLRNANITARLAALPTRAEIEKLDAERFVSDVTALLEGTTPAQKKIAATLLEKYSAEDLVAAFVRREQQVLPSIEDLSMTQKLVTRSSSATPERDSFRGASQPGRPQSSSGDFVWFQVNTGRTQQADPKWLIPMICRRGNVQKSDIGQINVLFRHTEFEIKRRSAALFEESTQKPDEKDPKIKFVRLADEPGQEPPVERAPEPRRETKPKATESKPKAEVPKPVEVAPVAKKEDVKETTPTPKIVEAPAPKTFTVEAPKPTPVVETKVEEKPAKVKKTEAVAEAPAAKSEAPKKVAKEAKKEQAEAPKIEAREPVKEAPKKAPETKKHEAPKEKEQTESKPKDTKGSWLQAHIDRLTDERAEKPAKAVKPAKPAKPGVKANPWIEKFKQQADRKGKTAPAKKSKK